MNVFALTSLLASVVTLLFGNFVFYRNPKNLLNRIFFLFCLSGAYLSFTEFGYRQADTFDEADFWMKASAFYPFAVSLELHFVLLFSEKTKLLENKLTYLLSYVPALGFSFFNLTSLAAIEPVRVYWGWTYSMTENTMVFYLLDMWVVGIGFFSLYICLQYYLKANERQKKEQAKYVLLGISICMATGLISEDLLPFRSMGIPELTSVGFVFECIFLGYAVWKHKLFALTPATAAESIISTMADVMLLVSPEEKIVMLNQATLGLLGYEKNELIHQPVTILFPPEENARLKEIWHEHLETAGSIGDIETAFKTKDARKIPISLSGSVLRDEDGAERGKVYVARDLTERKRAQEEKKKLEVQLQRAQKMEAIGTLAGGVAHDLNNILSGLVSYPDLLLLELPEDSPLRNPIVTVQKSGEKAAAIVQDLLTMARRGVAVTEVVNLNHIISEYLKSPEHEKLKSFHPIVQMETNLETDLLNILGSPVHLSKTVMNLVSNAAEAMPDGGRILISTENRYVDRPIRGYDQVEEGDYVLLRISDTGVGIGSQDRERIFEPFYTKKVMGRSGTGLGMAVVWGTVKDHRGYIDVQSTEGEGTTFTLYFQVSRKEVAKDRSGLPIEDYMAKGESLLVVDDVEEQREMASRILKRLGYAVTSVASGEEAIDYLKDNSADLLVLDMIMDPGIDGLETYRRILESHPNQKAIIVSGFSETERVKETQRLGAGAYVKKPYLLEKIGLAVRDELDKEYELHCFGD